MRPELALSLLILLLSCATDSVWGQGLADPAMPPVAPLPVPPPQHDEMRDLYRTATDADASVKPWVVDVLIGLPTAVRAEWALNPESQHPLAIESFVGFYFIFPMAGGGLRWNLTLPTGAHDAILFRPGVDAVVMLVVLPFWDEVVVGGLGLVSADVECAWKHSFSRHVDGELGFKLGGGVGFANHAAFLPIAGVFAGWRF